MKKYPFALEPYKGAITRHQCPKCKKPKSFTRYINVDTGEYLAANVGRCNSEDSCTYHYPPREYFEENKQWINAGQPKDSYATQRAGQQKAALPISFIPITALEQSMADYTDNCFVAFTNSIFGVDVASQLVKKYRIGSSSHWRGAVTFPQIDNNGNIRQLKVMDYNPKTGKRKKAADASLKLNQKTGEYYKDVNGEDKIYFAGKRIVGNWDANFVQCFFGEHLLNAAIKPVVLVEGEKTAVITSGYLPEYEWIATGGINGCKWYQEDVCKVLKRHDVILCPDLNAFERWEQKSLVLSSLANSYSIKDLSELNISDSERKEGLDIADFLLKIPFKDFTHNHKKYFTDFLNKKS